MRNGIFILLLLGGYFSTNAQIIAIRNSFSPDTMGWQGQVKINFLNTKNTQQIFNIKGEAQFQHRAGLNKWFIVAASNQILLSSEESPNQINNGFSHVRYSYLVSDKWEWEGFVQAQYDQVLKIAFRGLAGAGFKHNLIREDKNQLSYNIDLMWEYEQEAENGIYHSDPRLSTFISFSRQFTNRLKGNLNAYYQPRLDKWNDYRISGSMSLEASVISHLNWELQVNVINDTYPVQTADIPKLTYNILNGLVYRF